MDVSLPSGTLTLFFADVEGSTELVQRVGQTKWAAALETYRTLVRGIVAARSGVEVDTAGDSFFVAFTDAVAAAVAANEVHAVVEASALSALPMRTRIGLHTGQPLLVGDHYVGVDLHQAARVMAAGHGGQTLMSEAAERAVRGRLPTGASVTSLGTHRLKDLSEPQELYQLDAATPPQRFPPVKTLQDHPNNLPVQLSSFIGRTGEQAEITALLDGGARLVTLTGPGGVGKTRLALQCAAERVGSHAGGTFFVALAGVGQPVLVPDAVADAIGLRPRPGESLDETLTHYLTSQSLLLVLDNLEHLLDAAARVSRWLQQARDLTVIVTSRVPLRIAGEKLLHVE